MTIKQRVDYLLLATSILSLVGCMQDQDSIMEQDHWAFTDKTTTHILRDSNDDSYRIYLTPTGAFLSNSEGQDVELWVTDYEGNNMYLAARGNAAIPENGRLVGFVYVTAEGKWDSRPIVFYESLCYVTTYLPSTTHEGMISNENSAGSDEKHYYYHPIKWEIPGRTFPDSWFDEIDSIQFKTAQDHLKLEHEGGLKWRLIESSR